MLLVTLLHLDPILPHNISGNCVSLIPYNINIIFIYFIVNILKIWPTYVLKNKQNLMFITKNYFHISNKYIFQQKKTFTVILPNN